VALVRLSVSASPLLGGKKFGDVGAYEQLDGEAEFAVDPDHPLNRAIVDLDLAPRDDQGRVRFSSDVRILRPIDPSRGNRGLFLDVVNRGTSIFTRMLEPGPMGPSTGVTEGFLMRRGFTVVACGWQHDIRRGNGSFGLSAPEATSVGAPVTGVGFMALRDLVSYLRETYGLNFAVALGASQSGRLLRQLVFLGMCEDETGRLALDGVLAVAAGARMTEANLRFGEPSSNGPRSSGFPMTDAEILRRAIERSVVPKIIHLNTSSEYWSSSAIEHVSAALCHVSPDGRSDAAIPENVRLYLCASTQHAPSPLGGPADGSGVHAPNTIDYKPFVRAAVDNLTAWVTCGRTPPPSVFPRFSDGTLTADLHPSTDADGNELGGLRHPDVSVPLATYTGWNPARGADGALVRARGSTIPFAPRVIATCYPSRAIFLDRVRQAAQTLVGQRYLLADDVEPLVAASADRWNC
jgi:alpha/beta hydrolase family protein